MQVHLCGSFSVVDTTVLRDLHLVESTDGKRQIRRYHYKLYSGFQLRRGWAPLTLMFKDQLHMSEVMS